MFLTFSALLLTVSAQQLDIDQKTLLDVFGDPGLQPTNAQPVPLTATVQGGSAGSAGELDLDEDALLAVFNGDSGTTSTESSKTIATTVDLSSIFVMPTTETSKFKDNNNETCQCVPYYLCDKDKDELTKTSGWNELDVRFGGPDDCQESVEVCCTPLQKRKEVRKREPIKMKGCGYRNPNGIGVTIRGGSGKEAQFGEFPWVVALINTMNNSYVGVGVIIHPEVVMTTAHYASKYAPGQLKIRAGEWDTQTVKEELAFQEREIREIYNHQDFNSGSFLINDIALLRLEKPLVLAEHINTICMPDQDEDFESYKKCLANGWGKDVFGVQGRYAVILKRVEVDMVTHNQCEMRLKQTRLGSRFRLHYSFLCAGGEPGKDTCEGDGGAPLACPIGNDRYKLTGLVVGGIGCGQPGVPAIHTAVPAFRNWVDSKMTQWGYGTDSYKI